MASNYAREPSTAAAKQPAAGFINLSQPCEGGREHKVSFKPLDLSDHMDKQIYEMLHKDLDKLSPEEAQKLLDARATKWVRQLTATFRYGGDNSKAVKPVSTFKIVD
jgi:hypothetical protein